MNASFLGQNSVLNTAFKTVVIYVILSKRTFFIPVHNKITLLPIFGNADSITDLDRILVHDVY